MNDFWSWSFRCCRVSGITIRIHWSLPAVAVFQAVGGMGQGIPWLVLPILLAIPIFSVALHELGHVVATRSVGGRSDEVVLWALGGLAVCQVPNRPLPEFIASAAGPLVNLGLWGACLGLLASAPGLDGILALLLAYTAGINLILLLFNLIPCYPLDGGVMLRAALWPLMGLRLAIISTIWLAYLCLAGMLIWSAFNHQFVLFLVALSLGFTVIQEHRMVRAGIDPRNGYDLGGASQRQGFWERWSRRRAAAAVVRQTQEAAADQEVLDRLLAKVSAEGLPALNADERAILQRISKRQQRRAR